MAQTRHSGATKRRPRAGEVRTRSGCWKCRERRVKCPEQRPICRHCERLGFACAYDIRLTWQVIPLESGGTPSRLLKKRPLPSVEEWMFLNTGHDDLTETGECVNEVLSEDGSSCYAQSVVSVSSRVSDGVFPSSPSSTASVLSLDWEYSSPIISPSIQPLAISQEDAYLWNHFSVGLTPRLVVCDKSNPFRTAVMRMAASSPEGPLFQCIIGASATQLYKLGTKAMRTRVWQCRANALSILRRTMQAQGDTAFDLHSNPTLAGQVVGSALMLCFSEILQDCPDSWTSHVDFVLSFLQGKDVDTLDPVLRDLMQFSTAYFTSHRVLAATASSKRFVRTPVPTDDSRRVTPMRALTGCPDRLFALISDVTSLAYDRDTAALTPAEFADGRDRTERQLHEISWLRPPTSSSSSCSSSFSPSSSSTSPSSSPPLDPEDAEIEQVTELKSLTALLYFYSRVDGAGPQDPRIARLTARILPLLRRTSLRTHTALWSLFVVGALGVPREGDEERKAVMETLAALQRTRELGNVRKARRILEDVWRRRDLRLSCANLGWSILPDKYGTVSLV